MTNKNRDWGKTIVQLFKNFNFKSEIKINLIEVDFFHVTFNLIKEPLPWYKKPNNNLSYINISSNHPPNIIKRLSKLNKLLTAK